MPDLSYKDTKYFVTPKTYNCPYCNRRSIGFSVTQKTTFDWSEDRWVAIYIVKCDDCNKESAHFSDYNFDTTYASSGFSRPDDEEIEELDEDNLDNYFFYHQPTTFFTVDSRIPKEVRELLTEADGCRDMNFLVGASGAMRKAVYEFLKAQEVNKDLSYKEQIKSLKAKYPLVDQSLFSILGNIQGMTSEQLHEKEGSWEAWTSQDLIFLTQMFIELLREIYVVPDERKKNLDRISTLRTKSSFRESSK